MTNEEMITYIHKPVRLKSKANFPDESPIGIITGIGLNPATNRLAFLVNGDWDHYYGISMLTFVKTPKRVMTKILHSCSGCLFHKTVDGFADHYNVCAYDEKNIKTISCEVSDTDSQLKADLMMLDYFTNHCPLKVRK
jgi:hypothetical protein